MNFITINDTRINLDHISHYYPTMSKSEVNDPHTNKPFYYFWVYLITITDISNPIKLFTESKKHQEELLEILDHHSKSIQIIIQPPTQS